MAVDVSEPFISPRISFSYDLNNQSSDIITTTFTTTTTTTTTAATSTTTFEFCITLNLLQQITSADELFYDGVLLPTQIKKPENLLPKPVTPVENKAMHVHRKRLKELLSDNDDEQHKQLKSSSTSFWKFARSTSLNSENGRGPKRLFRSLSLKRLLQSNYSSDSALNPRENDAPVVVEKLNSGKEPAMSRIHHSCQGDNSCRRSATKKNSGNGNKVNPMLNIPPAYNMNLFHYFVNPKTKPDKLYFL